MKNTYQQIKDEFQGGTIYILLSAISKMCKTDYTYQNKIQSSELLIIYKSKIPYEFVIAYVCVYSG